MSHFRNKGGFKNALCGLRFKSMGERNTHEETCAECQRNLAIMRGQAGGQ